MIATASTVFFFLLGSATLASAGAPEPSVDLPCIDKWTGPSGSNTFECDTDSLMTFVKNPAVWSTVIPFVLGFLILFPISCILICGRYLCNCCGSSKMRPSSLCGGKCCGEDPDDAIPAAVHVTDKMKYGDNCMWAVRVMCVLLVALAVAGVVLSYVGGAGLSTGVADVEPMLDRIVDWALEIVENVKLAVQDPSSDPPTYPDQFDVTMLDSAVSDINSMRTDAKDTIVPYLDIAKLVTTILSYVSIVPALVLFIPIISAFFSVRRCLPMIGVLFAFFFQFIYYLLGTVCLILVLAFGIIVKDLSATDTSQRTLLQWYLVPMCDESAPFAAASDNLQTIERDASVGACEELLNFCVESTATYDFVTDGERTFYCNLTTPSTECTTIASLSAVVASMYVRDGVPSNYACGAAVPASECTLSKCSTDCEQTNTRTAAKNAVDGLATAERVFAALDTYLRPYLACDPLFQKVLSLGLISTFEKVEDGFYSLAVGAVIISSALVLSILVNFLGQKRFVNKGSMQKEADEWWASQGVVGGVAAAEPEQNPLNQFNNTNTTNDGLVATGNQKQWEDASGAVQPFGYP